MREVTRDEFFKTLGPLNVHPNNRDPEVTTWETPSRAVVGQSLPGWHNPGDPRRYFLVV